MFDWSDLRFALAVARGGSIAAAARSLRVDATTVTRRLKTLEKTLGSRLFERHSSGLRPTTAGEQVIAAATRMELETIGLERAVSATDARIEGSVRVTTIESLSSGFLSEHLPPLLEAHPHLRIELVTGDQLLDLSRSEADIAIRVGSTQQEGVIARKIAKVGHAVYASRAYLAAHGTPESPEALREHRCIGFTERIAHAPEARWLLERAGPRGFSFRSASSLTLILAARGGAGVGLLPCYLADQHEELVRLFGGEVVMDREFWLHFHAELRKIARVRVVVDHLLQLFRRHAALFERGTRT